MKDPGEVIKNRVSGGKSRDGGGGARVEMRYDQGV